MPFDPVTSKVAADVQAFWDAMMRVQAAQNAVMVGERALAEQRQALADAAIKLLAARLRRNELAPTTQDSARRLYPDSRADPPVTSEPALPEAPVLNLLAFSDRAERRLAQYRKAVREVRRLEPIVDARQHAVERLAADLAERRRRLTQEESALAELRWRVDQNAAAARRPRAGRAADPAQRSQVDGNAGPTAGDRRDSPPTSYSGGRLLQPVRGRLSSRFGNRYDPYYHVYQLHAGADFAAPKGTTIRAAAAGRVARAGVFGGYGRFVCIEHGRFRDQRLSTCYAHQSRILVRVGLQVAAGEPIGLVGSTGASTGPHLHFEVRLGGRPVDPLPWL
jgi:murein DD-endopeptidase MepM/ murein hydrolase activator NlpD